MDPRDHIRRVTVLLSDLVEGTDESQLDDATPCDDFRVRDLIGHFTFGRSLFAAILGGDTARRDELLGGMPARFGDVLGDDHRAAFRSATGELDAALDGLEDLDEEVDSLLFGTVPLGALTQVLSGDNLVHCWDLARGTGQGFDPSDDLVEATAGFFDGFVTDETRGSGAFGPAVEVPEDASALDRLVAFCGRTP